MKIGFFSRSLRFSALLCKGKPYVLYNYIDFSPPMVVFALELAVDALTFH